MFPFQRRDELVFGAPKISTADQKILQDLIFHDHADISQLESHDDDDHRSTNIINFSNYNQLPLPPKTRLIGFRRPMKTETTDHVVVDGCGNNNNSSSSSSSTTKRLMHRDIERRRRQEIANLHLSLRSLLPLEQLKGKWSVCDQMQQVVNYITHKQKSIEDLRIRRDELKKISKLSAKNHVSNIGSQDCLSNCVKVKVVCEEGLLEILITSRRAELGLSRVMAELLEMELDVVSCVSTRATDGMFLHKIQSEGKNVTSLDLPMLQEILTNAVN